MSIELTAYTAEGLLTGSVVADRRLLDLLGTQPSLVVDDAALIPFDGPPQRAGGRAEVDVDDLLAVVATAETVTPFHAVWHPIALDLGPYRVCGELPSLPGFDPARALARPTGSFILVGRVTVELRTEGLASGLNEHAFLWINRYAVDGVRSDLELGFFFPGALDPRVTPAIA